jgi:acyl-lipid omega-6 desaturase (Delta-12 desaturase)
VATAAHLPQSRLSAIGEVVLKVPIREAEIVKNGSKVRFAGATFNVLFFAGRDAKRLLASPGPRKRLDALPRAFLSGWCSPRVSPSARPDGEPDDVTTTAPPSTPDSPPGGRKRPFWRDAVAPYEQPDVGRSLLDLATSVLPYLALSAAMYFLLDVSWLLSLALAPLAAGFLLRAFIVFHDCAHGSFLPTKRANAWLGRCVGLLVAAPYQSWQYEHAVHHATSGDLDRRGIGDVETLTVAEYRAAGFWGRLGYRLFRNPAVMFGLGPIWAMLVLPRFDLPCKRARIVRSVWGTNVALAAFVVAWCWLLGWQDFLLVWLPPVLMAGSVGVWLFYVQHQFEDAYWESGDHWSYADAALRGSSYLELPVVLRFFTGNIGLHHVHHLSARIPNYNLKRAHDENPIFHDVPTLSLWDGLRAVRLKLWDEERGRLVTFAEAR